MLLGVTTTDKISQGGSILNDQVLLPAVSNMKKIVKVVEA